MDKLQALGHDVSNLHCKSWHAFAGRDAPQIDFLIALCDTLDGPRVACAFLVYMLPPLPRCSGRAYSKRAASRKWAWTLDTEATGDLSMSPLSNGTGSSNPLPSATIEDII